MQSASDQLHGLDGAPTQEIRGGFLVGICGSPAESPSRASLAWKSRADCHKVESVLVNCERLEGEIEKEPYHTVICAALAPKKHRLRAHAFINYALWKHALVSNSKDECSVRVVILWLALVPHL